MLKQKDYNFFYLIWLILILFLFLSLFVILFTRVIFIRTYLCNLLTYWLHNSIIYWKKDQLSPIRALIFRSRSHLHVYTFH